LIIINVKFVKIPVKHAHLLQIAKNVKTQILFGILLNKAVKNAKMENIEKLQKLTNVWLIAEKENMVIKMIYYVNSVKATVNYVQMIKIVKNV